ncbi:MAG: LytTR family DNA-binding domain-containing protein [Owenweeksia sp.]|nr:LytTR family DNA-binding domain-containing protein [Owenweeksia sp.]
MKELRSIIVDDDALSREVLRKCISQHQSLKLVGSYHNALEAKMALASKELDLVFLDVEMPEMTGFELLDSYKNVPQVIMVTSKKQYAFDAFRYDVTDFLAKPIDNERFEKSVERALFYSQNLAQSATENHSIMIKSDGVLIKVNTNNIDYVEAMGDYIKVVVGEKNHVVHSTMKAFMAQLPDAFLRVHKSYIVNLDKVVEMDDTHLIGDYFQFTGKPLLQNDVRSRFKSGDTNANSSSEEV